MAAQPTLIQSVVRALDLLDAVGAADQPVPAKRLAHLVDLPLPTTYHLLRTLVHEGYLVRTAEGYALGDRVDALAAQISPHRVRQMLQRLHDEVGAAAYLALLKDGEIRVAQIVDSPAAPRTDLWVGLPAAAHATALGKAVLVTLPEAERRDYLAGHRLHDLTPHTITSRPVLLRECATGTGLTVDREEYVLGTFCVAASVPGQPMAVAVSAPAHQAQELFARARSLRRTAQLVALAAAA